MKIEQIIVGPLQSNSYIVYEEKSHDGMVIDPGDDPGVILNIIEKKKIRVLSITCTHGHFDHISAVSELKKKTEADVLLHKDELAIYMQAQKQGAMWGYNVPEPAKPDRFVEDGDLIVIGNMKFSVLHTPGHSPGGICIYRTGVIFTGDTVFAGSVGRTDFFGGSIARLKESFRKILSFDPETIILPGHGERSTVGDERKYNFFIHEI